MMLSIDVSLAGDSPGVVHESPQTAIVVVGTGDVPVAVLLHTLQRSFETVKLCPEEFILLAAQKQADELKLVAIETVYLDCESPPSVYTPLKIDATGVLPYKEPPTLRKLARCDC